MLWKSFTTVLAAVSIPTALAGPPCSGTRPSALCARYIRPYSDNAYEWGSICGFTAASGALIADNVEMYDAGAGCDEVIYFATCCARFGGCGNGIDCDGPETALPTTQVTALELPTGWEVAVTCAVDNPSRVLANAVVSYVPSNDPYNCASSCIAKGYPYAGVEYADECYCGTGYVGGVAPPVADASDCNMLCAGSYYYYCGGPWRMQIYKAVGAP